ncbi:MAG: exodeoxyribonuclease VII small subunit [Deltaproteobacteria bacterium]|nr:exodeoxyribonuclease VII small subunit [Deltaproteobacteria bacterium]MBW2361391.1 exodeoxyribonuclease VII small subunit [Deltaproteobacteria bacterium]
MARRRAAESETPEPQRAEGEPSFEAGLERLEAIVDRLEQGELPLEEALAAFEEGVALTRRCAGQLEVAERRIEELVKDGDNWLTRPFEAADEDEA